MKGRGRFGMSSARRKKAPSFRRNSTVQEDYTSCRYVAGVRIVRLFRCGRDVLQGMLVGEVQTPGVKMGLMAGRLRTGQFIPTCVCRTPRLPQQMQGPPKIRSLRKAALNSFRVWLCFVLSFPPNLEQFHVLQQHAAAAAAAHISSLAWLRERNR